MRIAVLAALTACGDNLPPPPDGPVPDVGPDTGPLPAGCDWAELADVLNDITLGNGIAEATALTLDDALVICGRIDTGHLLDGTVDVDAYEIHIAERAQVRIDFAGDASAVASLEVSVLDAASAVVAGGAYLGTHAAFATTLSPGTYRVVVTASNATDLRAGFDYQLRAIENPPPCMPATSTPVVETDDGPQSNRNDVVEVRYLTGERTLTSATNDAPEATGIVTAAGTDVRVTGTSDDVDRADEFRDRDTYLIETGAHDELAVRIDWTGDADFDVLVFPENSTTEIASGSTVGKTGPELVAFPVLANTRYWVWIGSYDTSAGLPLDYDVTLCPTQFAE